MTRIATILALSAWALGVSAQDLRLFEPTETEVETGPQQRPLDPAIDNSTARPAFTLKSVSRFGDEVHAVLVNRAGESLRASWQQGQRAPVPGNGTFAIVGFEAGTLQLAYPPLEPCFEVKSSGVSCLPGNVALLRLATAAPLATNGAGSVQNQQGQGRNTPVVGTRVTGDPGTVVMGPDASGPAFFINPFNGEAQAVQNLSPEQQAQLERQQQRAARLRNVEAVRIDEANVPNGMRVVRTPFGDRLVPVRE